MKMKKLILSVVFLFITVPMLLFTVPMLLSSFSSVDPTEPYYRDSSSSVVLSDTSAAFPQTQKAREETVETAGIIVQKLAQRDVFSSEFCLTTESYYETAMWVATELESFEAEPDASLALIDVYEDILAEARDFDFEKYYTEVKAHSDAKTDPDRAPEAPSEPSKEYRQGFDLMKRRETVEGLLALDVYYDRLGQTDIQKMTGFFEEFAELQYEPAVKVCGSARSGTLFEVYRESRNGQPGSYLLCDATSDRKHTTNSSSTDKS